MFLHRLRMGRIVDTGYSVRVGEAIVHVTATRRIVRSEEKIDFYLSIDAPDHIKIERDVDPETGAPR